LSNAARKLLWFEITKMQFKIYIYCVIYDNFRHTFVPYYDWLSAGEYFRFENFGCVVVVMEYYIGYTNLMKQSVVDDSTVILGACRLG